MNLLELDVGITILQRMRNTPQKNEHVREKKNNPISNYRRLASLFLPTGALLQVTIQLEIA